MPVGGEGPADDASHSSEAASLPVGGEGPAADVLHPPAITLVLGRQQDVRLLQSTGEHAPGEDFQHIRYQGDGTSEQRTVRLGPQSDARTYEPEPEDVEEDDEREDTHSAPDVSHPHWRAARKERDRARDRANVSAVPMWRQLATNMAQTQGLRTPFTCFGRDRAGHPAVSSSSGAQGSGGEKERNDSDVVMDNGQLDPDDPSQRSAPVEPGLVLGGFRIPPDTVCCRCGEGVSWQPLEFCPRCIAPWSGGRITWRNDGQFLDAMQVATT